MDKYIPQRKQINWVEKPIETQTRSLFIGQRQPIFFSDEEIIAEKSVQKFEKIIPKIMNDNYKYDTNKYYNKLMRERF